MRFFCYARKSVYSDHSDSVDNQCRMCRDYADSKFPGEIESWTVFSDEAYSGANIDRPQMKDMLDRLENHEADILIVYQLDRLSRNVRDFSNIYAMLEERGILFVSLKESIDTATPIGRAMMYVTVVFAQMERETIATRVGDNMTGLAKKGFWHGGKPPIGYAITKTVVNGRKHSMLVPDPDGAAYLQNLYHEFITSGKSLRHMEIVYRDAGIKSRNGSFMSDALIYSILTSPFCCAATPAVYDFFAAKGCNMDPGSPREKWDGSVGVMVYGRHTMVNKKYEHTTPDKWLVCLGLHKPIIDADLWLSVQDVFRRNTYCKTSKYPPTLLKGVVRCGQCGQLLNVQWKKRKNGNVVSYYRCIKHTRRGDEFCKLKSIKCDLLDDKVLEIFRGIAADPDLIRQYCETDPSAGNGPDRKKIAARLDACNRKIESLTESLSLASGSTAQKYIISEMERLDAEMVSLRRDLDQANAAERKRKSDAADVSAKAAEIADLIHGLDNFTDEERNRIVRKLVKSCTWDGETLFLSL